MMFLYLITFFLQLIRPKVESITILMKSAPKQYLITFKLQLLFTKKLNCNYNLNNMRKCNRYIQLRYYNYSVIDPTLIRSTNSLINFILNNSLDYSKISAFLKPI